MEAASGDGVDAVFDEAEVFGGVDAEVGAFTDVAADEPVAVLVGGALPWGVGVGEVHLRAGEFGQVGVAGHLSALVPGQGRAQRFGDAVEELDHGGQGGFCGVAFGKVGEP